MANILDYLAWRGDLRFHERPFNEVDNLIFSELAYADWGGFVPEDGTRVPLVQACRQYLDGGRDQSYLANDPRPLAAALPECERFRDVELSRYVSKTDTEQQLQFAAITFHMEDGNLYVAYRGTDNSIVGWREDFNMSFLSHTPGQAEAAAYLDRAAAENDGPILVGGHSKGGNFAVYAAAFCESTPPERIRRVYSNDGPGFNRAVADDPRVRAVKDKVSLYLPESSLVGMLLDHRAQGRVIKSAVSGIQQHNPYTWLVSATRFAPAGKLSGGSLFLDEALGRWLDSLDDGQRARFVSTVFDAMEASGAMTLQELNENRRLSYSAMLKSLAALDPAAQKELLGVLGKLAAAGTDVFLNEAKKTFEELLQKKDGGTEEKEEKT